MKKYIFQLIVSDNQDTTAYQSGQSFSNIYTAVDYCKDNVEAYNKIMEWTYTVAENASEEYDEFIMLVNGLPLSHLLK